MANGDLRDGELHPTVRIALIVLGSAGAIAILALGWYMIFFLGAPAGPPPKPQHLVIGLDLSRESPLTGRGSFQRQAARRIQARVAGLPVRAKLSLRTFGDYSLESNGFSEDWLLAAREPRNPAVRPRRATPAGAGNTVSGIIAGIPALIEKRTFRIQESSNILGFLYNTAAVTDCEGADTTILLITDGVEQSEIVDLNETGASLPPPEAAIFKGCKELALLGLGQNLNSPRATERLRQEWKRWAEAAGFESFSGLNAW